MTDADHDPATTDSAASPEAASAAAEQPLDPLAQALADVAQWKDLALRARADHDNFRKRMTQEKADAVRFANGSLLECLLPVLDNFYFGLQAAAADPAAQNILTGLNMVAGQFQSFLRDQGVEEVAAAPGTPFDPSLHEAVSQQSVPGIAEGHVVAVVRRGFRLRDRLLRPASVVVAAAAQA